MKICVFADIHGNGVAFEEALPKILTEKADLNLFLGDLCGYFYDQIEIFSLIKTIPNLVAVIGNHDKFFLNIAKGNKTLQIAYSQKYGKSIDILLKKNYVPLIHWLEYHPISHVDIRYRIACFHGSPDRPLSGYVYPNDTPKFLARFPETVIFLGHTHYRMKIERNGEIIINPGSLGQPRDGGWPSYAIFYAETRQVEFKEITYDRESLLKRVRDCNDNPYLESVINRIHGKRST